MKLRLDGERNSDDNKAKVEELMGRGKKSMFLKILSELL